MHIRRGVVSCSLEAENLLPNHPSPPPIVSTYITVSTWRMAKASEVYPARLRLSTPCECGCGRRPHKILAVLKRNYEGVM